MEVKNSRNAGASDREMATSSNRAATRPATRTMCCLATALVNFEFGQVWSMVSKLNLYDRLTLLASIPGASELLFAPKAVATSSKETVTLIGENEIRDPVAFKSQSEALMG